MSNAPSPIPDERRIFNPALLSKVRIVSGFVLLIYVLFHFLNHAVGLFSLELMEQTGEFFRLFWRWWPFSLILYGSLLAHLMCAVIRVYQRGSFRMSLTDWAQLVLGLTIPFLMVVHIMGTRGAFTAYGINDSYAYVLISTVVVAPYNGWINATGLVVTWVHGCIGFYMWAHLKKWYRPNYSPIALVFSILIPALALAGYLSAGRETLALALDGEFMGAYFENLNIPDDKVWGWIVRDTSYIRSALIVLIGGVIVARIVKILLQRRSPKVKIDYVDGPVARQPIGLSLLEMSRNASVPHASICGGRGRCSTCRVRILSSQGELYPASEQERKVLQRVRAGSDVRLACQFFPTDDMKIVRLLPADTTLVAAYSLNPSSSGREQITTVMFVDIRDFTSKSEARLPFDVVYLINQFSKTMGIEVEAHNGRIDKFLGDGFMALFGINSPAKDGACNALAAAGSMIKALDQLNVQLAGDLESPLRIGIGIHTGSAIIGDMGYGDARGLTAIGDSVNIASRLEAATKTENCVLCVSSATVETAEMIAPEPSERQISVRGKKDKLSIYALNDIENLHPAPPAQMAGKLTEGT